MLFCDLLYHGKAKSGAFVSLGRDVGFEKAGALLFGQAKTVIDDLDADAVGLTAEAGYDAAFPAFRLVALLGCSLDGFCRILHEVGDGLIDEAIVDGADEWL